MRQVYSKQKEKKSVFYDSSHKGDSPREYLLSRAIITTQSISAEAELIYIAEKITVSVVSSRGQDGHLSSNTFSFFFFIIYRTLRPLEGKNKTYDRNYYCYYFLKVRIFFYPAQRSELSAKSLRV